MHWNLIIFRHPIVLLAFVVLLFIGWLVLRKRVVSTRRIITPTRFLLILILLTTIVYVYWIEYGDFHAALQGIRWFLARLYVIGGFLLLWLFFGLNIYLFWKFSPMIRVQARTFKELYQSSYLFNIFVLAVPTIIIVFVLAAVSGLPSSRFEPAIIAALSLLVPSLFAYYRAATVGEYCGNIGIFSVC